MAEVYTHSELGSERDEDTDHVWLRSESEDDPDHAELQPEGGATAVVAEAATSSDLATAADPGPANGGG